MTHYEVVEKKHGLSSIIFFPLTGRKHQIRKQLLIHGYPILGDNKYRLGNKRMSKKRNLMLHAYKIAFSIDGVKYNYTAELPHFFRNMLKEKFLKIFS